MNEKLQYATMLDIPVSTCNVTYKPAKKRRKVKKTVKNPEDIKEQLVSKVNAEIEKENAKTDTTIKNDDVLAEENVKTSGEEQYLAAITEEENDVEPAVENSAEEEITAEENEFESATVHPKNKKRAFKFTIITAELIVAAILVAGIFLTNAFYADSAINTFMRKVFSSGAVTAEVKTYDKFAPVMKFGGSMTLENGVITYAGSGAVYAAADGKVSSVTQETDGAFTVTVEHSPAFFSVISGLKYAYLGEGDAVYGTIPVGYAKDNGFTVRFATDAGAITDYSLDGGAVIWAV